MSSTVLFSIPAVLASQANMKMLINISIDTMFVASLALTSMDSAQSLLLLAK